MAEAADCVPPTSIRVPCRPPSRPRTVKNRLPPADEWVVMEQRFDPPPPDGIRWPHDAPDDVRAFFDLPEPAVEAAPALRSAPPSFPPPPPVGPPGGGTATMTMQPPALPRVAPPVPPPVTAPAASAFASAMNDHTPHGAPRPAQKRRSGGGKRFVGALLVLALLGGAGAAAVVYGSDLLTLAKGEEIVDEPELTKAFPRMPAVAPAIRTASFTVEQPAGTDGPESYQVTTDFETSIAEVVVDGGDRADLEILTLFNDAVARRSDGVIWYQLPRGAFPIDADLGRARWVRTIDELFPPAIRQWTTIERATESVLENEPMTRLLVSIEPARLASIPPSQVDDTEPPSPSADGDAAPPTEAAAAPPPAGQAPASPAVDPSPLPTLPPGITLTTTPEGAVSGAVPIEMWVDDAGVVRKLVLPPELGGQTVTVQSYSSEPWQPAFPTAEQVQPITAEAFFELSD